MDKNTHPFLRLMKYINNNPTKRKLTLQLGNQAWLETEAGVSCIYAPHFDEIIAPTYDSEFDEYL